MVLPSVLAAQQDAICLLAVKTVSREISTRLHSPPERRRGAEGGRGAERSGAAGVGGRSGREGAAGGAVRGTGRALQAPLGSAGVLTGGAALCRGCGVVCPAKKKVVTNLLIVLKEYEEALWNWHRPVRGCAALLQLMAARPGLCARIPRPRGCGPSAADGSACSLSWQRVRSAAGTDGVTWAGRETTGRTVINCVSLTSDRYPQFAFRSRDLSFPLFCATIFRSVLYWLEMRYKL